MEDPFRLELTRVDHVDDSNAVHRPGKKKSPAGGADPWAAQVVEHGQELRATQAPIATRAAPAEAVRPCPHCAADNDRNLHHRSCPVPVQNETTTSLRESVRKARVEVAVNQFGPGSLAGAMIDPVLSAFHADYRASNGKGRGNGS